LLGIISSGCLWATDVNFLNDTEELTYARPTAVKALRGRADELAASREDGGWDTAEELRAVVLRNIANELENSVRAESANTYHAYVSCFCEDGDLLSQWRAYGTENGYAIGFRSGRLLASSDVPDQVRFDGVVYGLEQARSHIDEMLEEAARPAAGFPGSTGNNRLMTIVLPAVATIKHPTFAEEKEWRLLTTTWGIPTGLQFRPGPVGLVPYLRFKFPPDAVAQVVVGPGLYSDARTNGIRQFLASCGLDSVEVVGSRSPLRL